MSKAAIAFSTCGMAGIGAAVLSAWSGTATSLPRVPALPAGPMGAISACFDAENPPSPEEMARITALLEASWGQDVGFQGRYNAAARWSGGVNGDPRALTWSFVPDGLNIPGGIGEPASASNLFATMNARQPQATWIAQVEAIFARWSALSGLSYTRVTFGGNPWDDSAVWGSAASAGRRGDVRISMHTIDGFGGILAYNGFPQNGDMVLDSGDANSFGSSVNTFRFFRNTLAHEHGHGFGLAHVCSNNSTQLMEPALTTSVDGPQQDDVRGSHRLYGDINEPDNSFGAAVSLGTVNVGPAVTVGIIPTPTIASASTLSIDGDGEQDWHEFTVTGNRLMSFIVTPVGSTYDDSDQLGNGSCASGNNINSVAIADLVLQVFQSNGTTIILNANATPVGQPETLTGVLISPPGDFFVRVLEAGTPTAVQMYRLSVQATSSPGMSATDGTFNDRVNVTWSNIVGNDGYRLYRNTVDNRATATIIASPATNSFSDLTASPGVTYFYWVDAIQGAISPRPVAGPETGFVAAPPDCPPDFDGDGFLTGNDFDAYVAAFEAGDISADYDEDGFLTGNDFDAYIADYEAGC